MKTIIPSTLLQGNGSEMLRAIRVEDVQSLVIEVVGRERQPFSSCKDFSVALVGSSKAQCKALAMDSGRWVGARWVEVAAESRFAIASAVFQRNMFTSLVSSCFRWIPRSSMFDFRVLARRKGMPWSQKNDLDMGRHVRWGHLIVLEFVPRSRTIEIP